MAPESTLGQVLSSSRHCSATLRWRHTKRHGWYRQAQAIHNISGAAAYAAATRALVMDRQTQAPWRVNTSLPMQLSTYQGSSLPLLRCAEWGGWAGEPCHHAHQHEVAATWHHSGWRLHVAPIVHRWSAPAQWPAQQEKAHAVAHSSAHDAAACTCSVECCWCPSALVSVQAYCQGGQSAQLLLM